MPTTNLYADVHAHTGRDAPRASFKVTHCVDGQPNLVSIDAPRHISFKLNAVRDVLGRLSELNLREELLPQLRDGVVSEDRTDVMAALTAAQLAATAERGTTIGAGAREWALVQTKIDEAQMWAARARLVKPTG